MALQRMQSDFSVSLAVLLHATLQATQAIEVLCFNSPSAT